MLFFNWIFICIILLIVLAINVKIIDKRDRKKEETEKPAWKKYQEETNQTYYDIKYDKGKLGEYYIYKLLDENISGYKRILANVYLFNKNGTRTEIDIIMIHETGFYIIESKRYTGYIIGNEKNENWTHIVYRHNQKYSYRIYNPILQNQHHVKVLKQTLNIMNPIYLNSYVVFSGNCKINKIVTSPTCNTKVLKIDSLIDKINIDISKSYRAFTIDQIDLYYQKLKVFANKDKDIKEKHKKRIKEIHS